ncbi:hypothetical protein K443DRAFT_684597 [Laccaria amethystina LaAM-08-1]|uniref:Uncharacterized protein n=1 Tax=Laccaria amethystina LaAM-08-1 TaxID=1095629 RepID=A0A0C9WIQ4_9AGAR|nr:hypothetical protein K443DRAFT_684597 [Laccaria amethystina LaAM-08-1]
MVEVYEGDRGCRFLLQVCLTSRMHAGSKNIESQAGTETWLTPYVSNPAYTTIQHSNDCAESAGD